MYTKKKIIYKMSIETLNYIKLNYKLYNFFLCQSIILFAYYYIERSKTDYQQSLLNND